MAEGDAHPTIGGGWDVDAAGPVCVGASWADTAVVAEDLHLDHVAATATLPLTGTPTADGVAGADLQLAAVDADGAVLGTAPFGSDAIAFRVPRSPGVATGVSLAFRHAATNTTVAGLDAAAGPWLVPEAPTPWALSAVPCGTAATLAAPGVPDMLTLGACGPASWAPGTSSSSRVPWRCGLVCGFMPDGTTPRVVHPLYLPTLVCDTDGAWYHEDATEANMAAAATEAATMRRDWSRVTAGAAVTLTTLGGVCPSSVDMMTYLAGGFINEVGATRAFEYAATLRAETGADVHPLSLAFPGSPTTDVPEYASSPASVVALCVGSSFVPWATQDGPVSESVAMLQWQPRGARVYPFAVASNPVNNAWGSAWEAVEGAGTGVSPPPAPGADAVASSGAALELAQVLPSGLSMGVGWSRNATTNAQLGHVAMNVTWRNASHTRTLMVPDAGATRWPWSSVGMMPLDSPLEPWTDVSMDLLGGSDWGSPVRVLASMEYVYPSATPSPTRTPSRTPSPSASGTPSPSASGTPSPTATPSPSASATPSPSSTRTGTPSASPSPTSTRTGTPSASPPPPRLRAGRRLQPRPRGRRTPRPRRGPRPPPPPKHPLGPARRCRLRLGLRLGLGRPPARLPRLRLGRRQGRHLRLGPGIQPQARPALGPQARPALGPQARPALGPQAAPRRPVPRPAQQRHPRAL